MSTMLLAENGKESSSKRTRHIDIRYYYITDLIVKKMIELKHCSTNDMIADFMTKPLQGERFVKLRNIILGIEKIIPNKERVECTQENMKEVTIRNKCTTSNIPVPEELT